MQSNAVIVNVDQFFSSDDYAKAMRKMNDALLTSDLATTENEEDVRPKRAPK